MKAIRAGLIFSFLLFAFCALSGAGEAPAPDTSAPAPSAPDSSVAAPAVAEAPAASAPADSPPALAPAEVDRRLDVAARMLEGGIADRALELARSVLDDPAAQATSGSEEEMRIWLPRREAARFLFDRARLGLAGDRAELEDVAEALTQLNHNRYRLAEPRYHVQAAYWAGRAYELLGEWTDAVEYYSRVGGVTLPPGMEGDSAQRTSRCLRSMADELPFPGGMRDRQRRAVLLDRAIAELDRARLAFPVGNRRKEIELDRIALRMARRDEQFVREAATEAEGFIESDPSKDALRARAVLYRGQAAALLGQPRDAAGWFRKVVEEEMPEPDDARHARLGLALALVEMAPGTGQEEKTRLLEQASESLDAATEGAISPGPWDGARVLKAKILLDMRQPSSALEALAPIINSDDFNPAALATAGLAELARGGLHEAFTHLYPATRPSAADPAVRYAALQDASRAADSRRDFGTALALNHQASRMLRGERLFSTLLASEFMAMEMRLKLGRMGGPVSLSSDIGLLSSDSPADVVPVTERRAAALDGLAGALAGIFRGGGDPDAGYDAAVAAEAAHAWAGEGMPGLELSIAMIAHLRQRQPAGVTDSVLSSRLGEARHSLALARAEKILAAPEPDPAEIDRTLGDFAAAAASFQEASAGGFSLADSLDQGMVNMESGSFLMRLSDKWSRGGWAPTASQWREEARLRIEASLRPFNQAIMTSGASGIAARRARWSRGRALELMGEWRGASADYLSLMNNSELPRVLRANAARRWAECMGRLGENRQALTRLAVFAEIDAEASLLAGRLAEDAGDPREAYQRYLFAADPAAQSLPPATPGRVQDAAYHAARLALASPHEANPLAAPGEVAARARELLQTAAMADLDGEWVIPMLNLLGETWMAGDGGAGEAADAAAAGAVTATGEPGWQAAHRLAYTVIEARDGDHPLDRAMRILAAKAMTAAKNYASALDELDAARELVDDLPASRADAASIALETARVYRLQGRNDDALRAYADVFAVYPEQEAVENAARVEAAEMLLSSADAGEREREQARGILSGLRDQMLAERLLREHGIQ